MNSKHKLVQSDGIFSDVNGGAFTTHNIKYGLNCQQGMAESLECGTQVQTQQVCGMGSYYQDLS